MDITSDLQNRLMGVDQSGPRTVTTQGVENEGDTSLFGGEEELGKEDFLNLLVTQLKYQDPLSPSNDQEFVAQLAQFSSLESSQNVESNIESLADSMKAFSESQASISGSLNNSSATSLLGKTARVAAPVEYFDGAQQVDLQASVEDNGAAYLQVINAEGEQVYLKPLGNESTGDYDVSWNGETMTEGVLATSGDYGFKITDITGKQEKGFLFEEAPVQGITYGSTGAEIKINGNTYGLGQIKQVIENP